MDYFTAKKEFMDLENKYFGVHKIKMLESGGSIPIADTKEVPSEVMDCLNNVTNPPKPKTKKTKKGSNK
jgi:hypothetical protein